MGNSVSDVIRPVIARAVIAGAFAREEEKAIHAVEQAQVMLNRLADAEARVEQQALPAQAGRLALGDGLLRLVRVAAIVDDDRGAALGQRDGVAVVDLEHTCCCQADGACIEIRFELGESRLQ